MVDREPRLSTENPHDSGVSSVIFGSLDELLAGLGRESDPRSDPTVELEDCIEIALFHETDVAVLDVYLDEEGNEVVVVVAEGARVDLRFPMTQADFNESIADLDARIARRRAPQVVGSQEPWDEHDGAGS